MLNNSSFLFRNTLLYVILLTQGDFLHSILDSCAKKKKAWMCRQQESCCCQALQKYRCLGKHYLSGWAALTLCPYGKWHYSQNYFWMSATESHLWILWNVMMNSLAQVRGTRTECWQLTAPTDRRKETLWCLNFAVPSNKDWTLLPVFW